MLGAGCGGISITLVPQFHSFLHTCTSLHKTFFIFKASWEMQNSIHTEQVWMNDRAAEVEE